MFMGLLPLFIYVLLHKKRGLKAAVVGAASAATLEGIYVFYLLGHISPATVLVLLTIYVSGYLAVRFESPSMFRLQPAVVRVVFPVFAIVFELINEPMIISSIPEMKLTMPDYAHFFENEMFINQMIVSMRVLYAVIFINAGLIYWSVRKNLSDRMWFMACMSVYPLAMLAGLIAPFLV
jgi:intracellular septation protein A